MKTKLIIATAMMATTAMAQPKLTPQNIDQVLKEMTLQEKATMLVGYTFGNSYWGLPSDPDPNAGAIVLGAAGNTAKIERLGIPHTVLTDGPAGVHISEKRPNDTNTYIARNSPSARCWPPLGTPNWWNAWARQWVTRRWNTVAMSSLVLA